jgi:hypothetical protein
VEAEGAPTSILVCFPFATGDAASAALFTLVLILSIPTFCAVTAIEVFYTIVLEGAMHFGTPALDAVAVFSIDFI